MRYYQRNIWFVQRVSAELNQHYLDGIYLLKILLKVELFVKRKYTILSPAVETGRRLNANTVMGLKVYGMKTWQGECLFTVIAGEQCDTGSDRGKPREGDD